MSDQETDGCDATGAAAKRGMLHVCPLSAVPSLVANARASHLITLLQNEVLVERPAGILPERHLRIHMHDIAEPLLGFVAPDQNHIAAIIAFAHAWAGQGPMVVHCWAGISRSTAAAYTALCSINPDVPEDLIAERLRRASPTAYPNRLMIRLADQALGRGGRMVRAVDAIGRGVVAAEARPFAIAADLSQLS
ncbi:MAG TPA: protein tyrosine phosphatase [Hyphomicrobiaceae bacterium]|nr:protein tyrosine phosphatase [Hyphomicrobiaceae bacterium]